MERNTVQRRAIYHVLEETGRPMGPNEIFDAAKPHAPGLGIATVYRTIKRLLEEGYLQQVDLPGEAPRYETAGKAHHHHFRCSHCHKVFDLQGCPNDFGGIVPKGFQLEGHEVYLFGRCEECTAA
ncbi:MAG: transcriptional repressor [Candidatus Eisenbacteria bacterium]|nr:transcriptional repressor [Candidatus Eisenbacteria bacterium]